MYTETMQKVFSDMLIDTLLDWDDWSADESPPTFRSSCLGKCHRHWTPLLKIELLFWKWQQSPALQLIFCLKTSSTNQRLHIALLTEFWDKVDRIIGEEFEQIAIKKKESTKG